MRGIEETELLRRADLGDAEARLQLVKEHLNLVVELAAAYAADTGRPFSQMVQAGTLAAIRAVDEFYASGRPAFQGDLLKLYQKYHGEIDIVMDKKLLFTLAFIQKLSPVTQQELVRHLGWAYDVLMGICGRLSKAGLLKSDNFDDPAASIELSQDGADLLRIFHSAGDATSESRRPKGSISEIDRFLRKRIPELILETNPG